MKKLTNEMVKKYLDADGSLCLFCGSENIDSQPIDDWGNCDVFCNNCHEQWKDIYQLIGVYHNYDQFIPKKGD